MPTNDTPSGGVGGLPPTCDAGAGVSHHTDDTNRVYYKGDYVPIEKYLQFERISYQQKTDPYPAIVPTISTRLNADFAKIGNVFGANKMATDLNCGKIYKKVVCSGTQNTLPKIQQTLFDLSEIKHTSYHKHLYCNDPGCPICYTKFAHRVADRVSERVEGYKSVYGVHTPLYHLVFWDSLRGSRDIKSLTLEMAGAKKMLSRMGAISAVVWYHPYRIKPEMKEALRIYKHRNKLAPSTGFWQMAHDDVLELGGIESYCYYSPHFHAIASGYLMNVKEYAGKGYGGYKKVRMLKTSDDIVNTSFYLSTHACIETGKHMVRYFGKISYSKLARGYPTEIIEDVKCDACGKLLKMYDCDETGIIIEGVTHDHVTQKTMKYLYWIRGNEPPKNSLRL